MNKYRDIVGRINYVLFLVAVATLPFPQVCIRYALVIWLVSWVLELRWLQPLNIKHSTLNIKRILPFALFALWYAWRGLSGLWSPDHRAWSFMMERYMTFALILPVGIWGVNEHYNWRTVAKVLAISCAASVIFYVIAMTVLYHSAQTPDFPAWRTDYHNWLECFALNSSCLKHRLFWCTTQLLGVIAAFQAWPAKDKSQISNLKSQILKWTIVVLSICALPLSGSRQIVFSLAAVIIIALIYFIKSKIANRKSQILVISLTIITILTIAAVSFVNHPRMKAMLQGDITMEQLTLKEPRVAIWQQVFSSPMDYFWTGLGGGQSVNYLEAKYNTHYMEYYSYMHYHAHNQYLEELMELGIFGLILFLAAWISIIVCAKGQGRRTAIYFVTICMLNMLTDCMWGKFDGIAIWAVAMIFILMQSKSAKIERK